MQPATRQFRTVARPVLIAALLAGIAPLSAAAVELEPYVFTGSRGGSLNFPTGIGCVTLEGQECPTSATTEDGSEGAWGLGAALRLKGPWWIDLRWSRQETDVRYFDPLMEAARFPAIPMEISHLHAGVLYRFLDRRWSPFVTGFGGIARIESEALMPLRSEIDLERASGGLGGGFMFDLASRVGLRLEVRGSRTNLPDDFDGDLEQVEGNIAFRVRI